MIIITYRLCCRFTNALSIFFTVKQDNILMTNFTQIDLHGSQTKKSLNLNKCSIKQEKMEMAIVGPFLVY